MDSVLTSSNGLCLFQQQSPQFTNWIPILVILSPLFVSISLGCLFFARPLMSKCHQSVVTLLSKSVPRPLLVRSREAHFACPNRRACSQARSINQHYAKIKSLILDTLDIVKRDNHNPPDYKDNTFECVAREKDIWDAG